MPESAQIPQNAPTFVDSFFPRCAAFGKDLLAEIPELESVAFVPTWHVPSQGISPAIICGRNGVNRGAAEVMQLVQQFAAAMKNQLDWLNSYLERVDRQCGEKATELRTLLKRIDDAAAALPADAVPAQAVSHP